MTGLGECVHTVYGISFVKTYDTHEMLRYVSVTINLLWKHDMFCAMHGKMELLAVSLIIEFIGVFRIPWYFRRQDRNSEISFHCLNTTLSVTIIILRSIDSVHSE